MMKLAKIWTTDRAFFVKIEKLLIKNNHFYTKLWTTLRSPRKARLNQGTRYSQGKVSSFQRIYILSYLNGWCGSYLRTTKGCRTRYKVKRIIYVVTYIRYLQISAWIWKSTSNFYIQFSTTILWPTYGNVFAECQRLPSPFAQGHGHESGRRAVDNGSSSKCTAVTAAAAVIISSAATAADSDDAAADCAGRQLQHQSSR